MKIGAEFELHSAAVWENFICYRLLVLTTLTCIFGVCNEADGVNVLRWLCYEREIVGVCRTAVREEGKKKLRGITRSRDLIGRFYCRRLDLHVICIYFTCGWISFFFKNIKNGSSWWMAGRRMSYPLFWFDLLVAAVNFGSGSRQRPECREAAIDAPKNDLTDFFFIFFRRDF